MHIYNFITIHPKRFKDFFVLFVIAILFVLYFLRGIVLVEGSVYYYTFSTIAQGFIALVAFLGTVVVFRLQLYENEMEKITDSVKLRVEYYRGNDANFYSPIEMMNECGQVLADQKNTTYRQEIDKYNKKMDQIMKNKGDMRNKMVDFTIISFVNVSAALVNILFPPYFVIHPLIGGIVLVLNISLSIYSLFFAWWVVRSSVGYSFSRQF